MVHVICIIPGKIIKFRIEVQKIIDSGIIDDACRKCTVNGKYPRLSPLDFISDLILVRKLDFAVAVISGNCHITPVEISTFPGLYHGKIDVFFNVTSGACPAGADIKAIRYSRNAGFFGNRISVLFLTSEHRIGNARILIGTYEIALKVIK